jgi:hypothetical protein
MPKPRSSQVSLIDTLYYHFVSRCVRRAFLCGTDKYSGTSYEHRRAWVEDKVLWLSSEKDRGQVACLTILLNLQLFYS